MPESPAGSLAGLVFTLNSTVALQYSAAMLIKRSLRLYLEKLSRWFLFGIGPLALIGGFLLGINLDERTRYVIEYLRQYSGVVVAMVAIVAGWQAAHSAIIEDRKQYSADFYQHNLPARKDRILRALYEVYSDGLVKASGSLVVKQEWDAGAKISIASHLGQGGRQAYMSQTGRSIIGDEPIKESNYKNALEFLKRQMDTNFSDFVRE